MSISSPSRFLCLGLLVVLGGVATAPVAQSQVPSVRPLDTPYDSDRDGLPDARDSCARLRYRPAFSWAQCQPMDLNPNNDFEPECKARERIADLLLNNGTFTTHVAFSVVKNGRVHFADAFTYIGLGRYVHDPDGVYRLYRIGSTSKAVTAVAAKIMEELGELSLDDFVSDDDGRQAFSGGQRQLRHLLSHQGAFKLDAGALHLFCYPGDLASFWAETDDLVSPHYDSARYGNLGGGFEYSAFNYSLAGTYLTHKAGRSFAQVLQDRVFDAMGMCTATLDSRRAVQSALGDRPGVSQSAVMHVGPTINLVAPSDPLCSDNFYSSDDLPGDPYTWQYYYLDEAGARARDPAGGVIASVVDMAHFAKSLLKSYRSPNGLISQSGIRELWGGRSDLGCFPNCSYQPYYGIGFFTDSQPGPRITEVEHGGSRAGFASALVLRPEENLAVSILANADVSTVTLSKLAKTILDDFR